MTQSDPMLRLIIFRSREEQSRSHISNDGSPHVNPSISNEIDEMALKLYKLRADVL